jgi:hypothetical protein
LSFVFFFIYCLPRVTTVPKLHRTCRAPAQGRAITVSTVKFHVLLPLTLLVAGPLLGSGGAARADYEAPESLVADAGMFSAPQTAFDATVSERQANQDSRSDLPVYGPQWWNPISVGHSAAPSTGATGQSVQVRSSNSTSLSSIPAVPRLDSPVRIGVLFLQEGRLQPPPFRTSLFRPPRRAWA